MPVSKKPVKKPKVKVQKGTGVTKSHKGTGVSKIKQKQKQSVSVNVTIDQSKKGKSSSSSVSRMQQPANIINFPSNTPVSEIRYNPIIINPEKLQDNNKVVSETSLVKTEEKPKLYVNPNRPIITDNSILGTVADVGLQLGSYALKEKYPEYSELVDVGGQVTDYIGKKFISGDIQKAGEGLTRQLNKGYKYLFGKKKDSSTSMDAWDTLSNLSTSTNTNETQNNLSASIPSTINSINFTKPKQVPRQVTIEMEDEVSSKLFTKPKQVPRQVTIEAEDEFSLSKSLVPMKTPAKKDKNNSDEMNNTFFNKTFESSRNELISPIKKNSPSNTLDMGETTIFVPQNTDESIITYNDEKPDFVYRGINTKSKTGTPRQSSDWNWFRTDNKNKNWSPAKMSEEYKNFKDRKNKK